MRQVDGAGGQEGDDDRDGELRDGGTEVAARGVQAQGPALFACRVEEGDVGHGAGEVAAAEAGQGRHQQHHTERGVRVGDAQRQPDGGDQEQQGRDDGPVAAAEAGNHEGVGDPEGRADQAGHRDQPEDFGGGEREAGCGELDDHDGPELPDDEAEELGEDGPVQVAAGDGAARRLPLFLVLGVPVGDPAAGAEFKGWASEGGRAVAADAGCPGEITELPVPASACGQQHGRPPSGDVVLPR